MNKTTEELLAILKKSPNISDYFDCAETELVNCTIGAYLNQIIEQKQLDIPTIIRRSGLDRTYCYQILSDGKHPSRDKVLALCFSMKLDFAEVQQLCKATGYPILYARIERDSVIIFSLQKHVSLTDVNELLYDLGHKELT